MRRFSNNDDLLQECFHHLFFPLRTIFLRKLFSHVNLFDRNKKKKSKRRSKRREKFYKFQSNSKAIYLPHFQIIGLVLENKEKDLKWNLNSWWEVKEKLDEECKLNQIPLDQQLLKFPVSFSVWRFWLQLHSKANSALNLSSWKTVLTFSVLKNRPFLKLQDSIREDCDETTLVPSFFSHTKNHKKVSLLDKLNNKDEVYGWKINSKPSQGW